MDTITPITATMRPAQAPRAEFGELEGMDRAGISEQSNAVKGPAGSAGTILLLGAGALAAYYFFGRK